ncbi:hypothetical protein [Aquimarina sp. RZ0]|uniref:hypothetical protein n=1 Tax=Aquimarina sp. RZ0 TaxID=2607730 RepID=UPI0011F0A6D7|nr:hypothetical protein [Aquimarina sp. RZ0]KAA1247172.1 hypothetical protein F0000_04490 [Aquimarina sp. RZ0]
MLKTINFAFLLFLLIIACQKEEKSQDPFLISNNRIGHLTHKTTLKQLDSIYSNDSIVRNIAGDKLLNTNNEIAIFEKGGKKLLILEVRQKSDINSTIKNIQLIDSRYHTDTGLSPNGTFKNIKDHYTITKITNTLSSAVLFVDSIQASLTIDKKELAADLKFNTDTKIEASQIPDSAKIKHFLISWDEN